MAREQQLLEAEILDGLDEHENPDPHTCEWSEEHGRWLCGRPSPPPPGSRYNAGAP